MQVRRERARVGTRGAGRWSGFLIFYYHHFPWIQRVQTRWPGLADMESTCCMYDVSKW